MSRLLLVALFIVGIVAMILSILWIVPAIIFAPSGSRVWKMLVTYDMLGNVTTGGDIGETISMRAYKASLAGSYTGCLMCKFLDKLQAKHCESVKV